MLPLTQSYATKMPTSQMNFIQPRIILPHPGQREGDQEGKDSSGILGSAEAQWPSSMQTSKGKLRKILPWEVHGFSLFFEKLFTIQALSSYISCWLVFSIGDYAISGKAD